MKFDDFEQLIKDGKVRVGDHVFITDYVFSDPTNKPLRHIAPQEVVLMSNDDLPYGKRIYYTDYHFRPVAKNGSLLARVIPPRDNTSYRGRIGNGVHVFMNFEEAVEQYVLLGEAGVAEIEEAREKVLKQLDDSIGLVRKNLETASKKI